MTKYFLHSHLGKNISLWFNDLSERESNMDPVNLLVLLTAVAVIVYLLGTYLPSLWSNIFLIIFFLLAFGYCFLQIRRTNREIKALLKDGLKGR